MVHTDESVPGLRPYSWDTAGHCVLGDPGVGFRTSFAVSRLCVVITFSEQMFHPPTFRRGPHPNDRNKAGRAPPWICAYWSTQNMECPGLVRVRIKTDDGNFRAAKGLRSIQLVAKDMKTDRCTGVT